MTTIDKKIFAGLNEPQREAVTHLTGPMLVVAGAGSGKTRVVTCRVAWLLTQGVKPWEILALTFTNKAAAEMRERVSQLVGDAPHRIGTFHAQCARFLRADIEKVELGRGGNFSIYDAADQQSLLKQISTDLRIDNNSINPRALGEAISRAKSQRQLPDAYPQNSFRERRIAEVYAEYENRLRAVNAVDFDDLLLLAALMLERSPEIRETYRHRHRFILVDEYQDTNRLQYQLLRLLCDPRENNLHATGDPDQSIYSWRGADYRNIMDFQQDFPGAKVVTLAQNYRSTANILAAANGLIANNKYRYEKSLFTADERGEKIACVELRDDNAEAAWVANQILAARDTGDRFSAMAILYRVNAQSRSFEEVLAKQRIPYQIIGGVRFYDRREIKDLLAHFKIRVNPADEISLRRIIAARPTGVGEVTLKKIIAIANAQKIAPFAMLADANFPQIYGEKVSPKLRDFSRWCAKLNDISIANAGDAALEILECSGLITQLASKSDRDEKWEERQENLEALIARAHDFGSREAEPTLARFLEDVALVADIDNYNRDSDAVTLMTLHSAKGLEFAHVFLTGVNDGLLPHSRAFAASARSEHEIEEERRLFYVGITRARQKLYLSRARIRFLNGQVTSSTASPFLAELPRDILETVVDFDGAPDDFADDVFPDDDDLPF